MRITMRYDEGLRFAASCQADNFVVEGDKVSFDADIALQALPKHCLVTNNPNMPEGCINVHNMDCNAVAGSEIHKLID